MTWARFDTAPPEVADAADIVRPRLGQACLQACMAVNGKRYAFVFDNGGRSLGYHWLELPPLPGERR